MDPLSNEEISKLLGQAAVYGNNSFIGDYRNARAAYKELKELYGEYDFDDPDYYDKTLAGLKGQMGTAIAGSLISGLNGATGIANNVMQATKLSDTSRYENELENYVDYSNYNFNSYDQLSNAMAQNTMPQSMSYDDIRGMSNGEKIGNFLSSGLQGAQAGMQIGGPVGAAIGGAAGFLSSGLGILSGNNAAQKQQDILKAKALNAQYEANQNFAASHERIGNYNNRKSAVNAAAKGGPINREMSIRSFANKVLGTSVAKQHIPSNITRIKDKDGIRVRIRVK